MSDEDWQAIADGSPTGGVQGEARRPLGGAIAVEMVDAAGEDDAVARGIAALGWICIGLAVLVSVAGVVQVVGGVLDDDTGTAVDGGFFLGAGLALALQGLLLVGFGRLVTYARAAAMLQARTVLVLSRAVQEDDR